MTPEERITSDLAEAASRRIATQVRIQLTKMTDCPLFGDDSPLRNTWEEICVQQQDEESFSWSAYEATIRALIEGYLAQLPRFELEAIWLQTDNAWDMLERDTSPNDPPDKRPAVYEPDIVSYILEEYVLRDAANWSNARIRSYLDKPRD